MHRPTKPQRGFTLIELLIVVSIILLLTVMTAGAINMTLNGDKVRAAGRQVQSYLAGARDRAIYAKAARGVRFQLDNMNPTNSSQGTSRQVTSMVFIAPTDPWSLGSFQVQYDANSQATILQGAIGQNDPQWQFLFSQNLLRNDARILLPNDPSGTWYTITTEFVKSNNQLHLTTPLLISPNRQSTGAGSPAFTNGSGPLTYQLQLASGILPNQEPVLLPKGTVIDLDRCNKMPGANPLSPATSTLPASWINASIAASAQLPFIYSNHMDIMFSPRGTVTGPAAGRGIIHLYVADQRDADKGLMPEIAPNDKNIITIFTRTGAVSVHHVDTTDTTTILGNNVYDYFRYAEFGQVAGK